jgi:hypothetical protein
MSQPPPPSIEPQPAPRDPGVRDRWRRRARWKRWSAYGIVTVVGIGALGAATTTPTTTASTPTTVTTPTTASPSTTRPTVTPTTVTPPSPAPSVATPRAGALAALDVLALIPIERETPDGYNRELFGYGAPVDEFGCRTRALVLIRDSLTSAQIDRGGCAVVAGDWFSFYDGATWSDPGEVQIDHVVALKEAWDSGASRWDARRLEAFANDVDEPRTLQVVTGEVNAAKGADDPVNWLPPDDAAVCRYLADWLSIKARWGLAMDESEHGRVRNLLTERCPGQLVAPWAPVPPPVPTDPIAPLPSPPAAVPNPPVSVPVPPAAPGNACDPAYPGVCIPPSPPDLDCGDITFRRFQVLPPDPHRFDGSDNDGLGCES